MQVLRWIVAADFRSLVAGTLRTAPTNLKSVVLASKSAIALPIANSIAQNNKKPSPTRRREGEKES